MDRETWELAQKLRKTPKRIDTLGEANPLTGLLYCADCGSKMYNQRSRGTESKPYPYDVFDYKLAGQKRSAACCGHHISTKALRTLILDTIRTVSTFAISNQEVFMEKVRSASQLRQAEAAKDAKRKLSKDKKRITELDTIIKKLYESVAVGRITDERFDSLLADYEAEQKTLQAAVTEAEERLSAFAEDSARVEQFLEKHPMKCVRGRLFTVDGLIEDEGQIGNLILEEISGVLTSGLSKGVPWLLSAADH